MTRPIRTVLFSTLYPSSARPGHGIFVETRLKEMLSESQVQTKVMAPVPWFPSSHSRFGSYARIASTPAREIWNGVDVLHPRYLLPPQVGMTVAPFLLAAACLGPLRALIARGFDFDLIDAHYYYPDGVAAAWLGRRLGKPVVITARGSDLNLIGTFAIPRFLMKWAAKQAAASIGVCKALVEVLRGWDVAGERLHVIPNGVDLNRFQLRPRNELRRELGLEGAPLLISVGHLIELKGHDLVIDAFARLLQTHPTAYLMIVGEGPERQRLQDHARATGVAERMRFTGALPQKDLPAWYGASDALVLASSREGWANVLLEAMACGTPVVATCVGGTPEVVGAPVAGRLVNERSAPALCTALRDLLAAPPSPERVRAYAEGFSWDVSSRQQLDLFHQIAEVRHG